MCFWPLLQACFPPIFSSNLSKRLLPDKGAAVVSEIGVAVQGQRVKCPSAMPWSCCTHWAFAGFLACLYVLNHCSFGAHVPAGTAQGQPLWMLLSVLVFSKVLHQVWEVSVAGTWLACVCCRTHVPGGAILAPAQARAASKELSAPLCPWVLDCA